MEVAEKATKAEQLLKLQLGKTLNVPVMAGNEREEKPPRPPNLRRAALATARQKRQTTRSIVQKEEKHACCMASGTLRNSKKY